MNKFSWIIIILIILIMAVVLVSCVKKTSKPSAKPSATPQRKIAGNVPKSLKEAIMKAPDDVIIGVGAARMATQSMAMTVAQTRARADISRQINSVVQTMVTKYTADSNASPEDKVVFTETITVQTSSATLNDTVVLEIDTDNDGYTWAAVSIKKESVADQISHSAAEAIITVPAMSSFDAKASFNEVFGEIFDVELGAGAK